MIKDIDLDGVLAALERQSELLTDYSLDVFLDYDFNDHAILGGTLTGGHVVTYLAREADRMADALLAAASQPVPEPDRGRRWELSENGNLRPGAVLVEDIRVSTERLRDAVAMVSHWSALDAEKRAIPTRRLLQLVVHLVDLGRPWSQLSDEDARVAAGALTDVLDEELAGYRLFVDDSASGLEWNRTGGTIEVSASARSLLAWATGRNTTTDGTVPGVPNALPAPTLRVWI